MESGWDPEVKNFFKKILNSVSLGLLWLMAFVTAGLYFKLAFADDNPVLYTIIFYIIAGTTFLCLLYYYYKLWKKDR